MVYGILDDIEYIDIIGGCDIYVQCMDSVLLRLLLFALTHSLILCFDTLSVDPYVYKSLYRYGLYVYGNGSNLCYHGRTLIQSGRSSMTNSFTLW